MTNLEVEEEHNDLLQVTSCCLFQTVRGLQMLKHNSGRITIRACRLHAQRFYVKATEASSTLKPAGTASNGRKSKFDKSTLKPLGLLVIFGSLLTNVMEERRKFNNMERRYNLKIDKLEELLERFRQGEKNIDIVGELKIIDAMFTVSENQNIAGLIARRKKEYDSDIKQVEHKEDESLDSIWQDIIESMDDVPEKSENKSIDLVTDPDVLEKRRAEENLMRKTAPSYMTHTIVESPGEVAEAAKDTPIKKFL